MANNELLIEQASKCLAKKKKLKYESEWYNLRPILGNANWALFYILLGSRETGKSYAITDYFCNEFQKHGTPFF